MGGGSLFFIVLIFNIPGVAGDVIKMIFITDVLAHLQNLAISRARKNQLKSSLLILTPKTQLTFICITKEPPRRRVKVKRSRMERMLKFKGPEEY